MSRLRCIGGCMALFFIAVALDCLGFILLFIGIFANLRVNGQFYGDFLIYTGALVVFISLGFWVMWYVGNVQVSEDEGWKKRTSRVVQLARKLSERLSQKLKGNVMYVEDEEPSRSRSRSSSQVSSPAHKASRVTWGRSTAYHNEGYEDSLDPPAGEKNVESEEEEKNQKNQEG